MVPAAAILYDVQGGAWVYVNESGHVYRRQRVELIETQGSSAYLARGLTPGTSVVTAGAAELFGTEFGAGK
jgi:multidrug efflux pump subunit AcrA (membrane-fusion protein)